jgi:Cys-rich protein (TIGR01571 family)
MLPHQPQSQQPVYPQLNQPPFIVLQNLPNHSHSQPPQPISQIIPQTIPQQQPQQSHRQWSTNICDCCIDPSSCCMAFLCPCCAFIKVSNNANNEKECCDGCCRGLCCLLLPCSVFIRAPYRKKLRVKYNLPAKPCNDCCTTFWCPFCALSQELREIENKQQPEKEQMKM